jgi:hypothetical protein
MLYRAGIRRNSSQIDEVHLPEPALIPAALDGIPDIKCNI